MNALIRQLKPQLALRTYARFTQNGLRNLARVPMTRAVFSGDWLLTEGKKGEPCRYHLGFVGYDTGETWNGWKSPCSSG